MSSNNFAFVKSDFIIVKFHGSKKWTHRVHSSQIIFVHYARRKIFLSSPSKVLTDAAMQNYTRYDLFCKIQRYR